MADSFRTPIEACRDRVKALESTLEGYQQFEVMDCTEAFGSTDELSGLRCETYSYNAERGTFSGVGCKMVKCESKIVSEADVGVAVFVSLLVVSLLAWMVRPRRR